MIKEPELQEEMAGDGASLHFQGPNQTKEVL
jgi:hypothetical protein